MAKFFRKPYRVKKKKSIFRNRFFWLTILALIITAGFFYLIYFHSFFQIKEIKISGNQKVATEDLENLLNEKINQKILFLPAGGWVESKSIFLVDFNEIKKEILKNFPQIAQVNLKKRFPNILIAEIEERKPIAIFCQEERYFFLDKEGIMFEEINTSSPDSAKASSFKEAAKIKDYLKLKSSTQPSPFNLGEKAVKKELLLLILEIESKLKDDFKIPIEEFLIVSDERVNAKTADSWEIYFNPKKDINWQLTKLNAVLEEGIPLERRKDLEYIELRFGNFAPYKYRQ